MSLFRYQPKSAVLLSLLATLLILAACQSSSTDNTRTLPDTSFQLDPSFNGTGLVTTSFSNGHNTALGMVLQGDGKIVIAGSIRQNSNTDILVVRFNTDGSVDTTFNAAGEIPGVVKFDVDGGDDLAYGVALQADTKIVIAGVSRNATTNRNEFMVARLNNDGTLDAGFNAAGAIPGVNTTAVSDDHNAASTVTLQADGRIVLAGVATIDRRDFLAVARYDANGVLDGSFNATGPLPGTWTYPASSRDNSPPVANAGATQTVVAAAAVNLSGSGSDSDGSVASYRWTQTGGPSVTLSNAITDTASFTAPSVVTNTLLSFQLAVTDNLGAVTTATTSVMVIAGGNAFPVANAGATQTVVAAAAVTLSGSGSDSDGSVASYTWTQTGGPSVTLSNANTDTASFTAPVVVTNTLLTFQLAVSDNLGAVTTATTSVLVMGMAESTVRAVSMQVDNRIVITGTGENAVVMRLNNDGSIDNTFGDFATGMKVLNDMSQGNGLLIQGDGSMFIVGATIGADTDMAIMRLDSSGQPDPAFGTAGLATVGFLNNRDDVATSLALQADSRIIVAGGASSNIGFDFALVRLNTNGSIDTSFGLNGKVSTPLGASSDAVTAVAIQADSRIVAAGSSWSKNHWILALARYLP